MKASDTPRLPAMGGEGRVRLGRRLSRRIGPGAVFAIGYLLSPLSWWNDAVVNLPIAYVVGAGFGLFSQSLFVPGLVLGYWLSNLAGLLLMHRALGRAARGKGAPGAGSLVRPLMIACLYTLVILALVWLGIIRFPADYLPLPPLE